MDAIALTLEPLTAKSFAPFGDVIEISEGNNILPINYGMTDRHHDLAHVDTDDDGGRPIISLFKTQAAELPFPIQLMERHPLGSQAFIMTTGNPYVVVVAKAGVFEHRELRAFLAAPHQGVNYHKGTWHHYCLGLNGVNEFLVVDRGGEGHNCDEIKIPDELSITVNH